MDFVYPNLLLPKFTLKCPLHPNNPISKICSDLKCSKPAFLCPLCIESAHISDSNSHPSPHLKSQEESILFLSEIIESLSNDNNKLYEEIFQGKENSNLNKWEQDNNEHLKKLEDHLIAQKVMIAEEIANLIASFSEICQEVKNDTLKKLDEYFVFYKEKFNDFKLFVDDSFQMIRKYKYYGNPNNLAAKIQSELPRNLTPFLTNLKQMINKTKEISENQKSFMKKIKKITNDLNELTNNLPYFQMEDGLQKVHEDLTEKITNFFSSKLKMPNLKDLNTQEQPDSGFFDFFNRKKVLGKLDLNLNVNKLEKDKEILKSRSKTTEKIFESRAQEHQKFDYSDEILKNFQCNYSTDNRHVAMNPGANFQSFSLKHQKSVAFEFQVTCGTILYDSILALGSKDNLLRIYDLKNQKNLHTVQAHIEPMVLINKINGSDDKYMNNKTKLYLITSSSDKSFYIWLVHENFMPHLYQKLTGFLSPIQSFLDFEDGVSLMTGDSNGELIVWDYHKSKILLAFRSQHSSKIVSINMLKKNERFIVASQDNTISLWRLRSNGKFFENFVCEKIITEKFGLISTLMVPMMDQELVVVGSCDGFIRLYDLTQNVIIAELQGYKAPINELVVIQERSRNDERNFVIIANALDEKGVRFVIYSRKNDGKKEHSLLNGKNEDFGVFGNNCKAKMQLFGNNQPMVLLIDEKKQEIGIMDICFK